MVDQVEYLGHIISEKGIAPTPGKINAIREAKAPENVSELQSFLGTENYLRKFVPHFAELASPLYTLLRKGENGIGNWNNRSLLKG